MKESIKEFLENTAIKNIADIKFEYFLKVLRSSSLIEKVSSRKKSLEYLEEVGWTERKKDWFIIPIVFFNKVKYRGWPYPENELFHWKDAIFVQHLIEMHNNF